MRRDGLYDHGVMSLGMGWQVPRLPGLGEVRWDRFFAALYAVGYDGPVVIEHEDRRFEGTEELVIRGLPPRARRPPPLHRVTLGIEDAAFVVCGGATAFGRAVARELVDNGARVLLVGPDLQALDEAVAELGDQALPCVAELADPDDASRVGGVAAALLGGVDGVVLAPVELPSGDLLDLPASEWVAVLSQSAWGPLGLLRGIVPLLEEGGAVVYVIPAEAGEEDAGRVVRSMLDALLEELAACCRRRIRVSRIEADPGLAGDGRAPARSAVSRLVVVAALLVPAGCGGTEHGWRLSPDPGVRVPNVVSAEALRLADGSLLLWANTPEGIEAFRSRDGLVFRRAAGRMPLGAHPTVVRLPGGRLRMYYSTAGCPPLRAVALA